MAAQREAVTRLREQTGALEVEFARNHGEGCGSAPRSRNGWKVVLRNCGSSPDSWWKNQRANRPNRYRLTKPPPATPPRKNSASEAVRTMGIEWRCVGLAREERRRLLFESGAARCRNLARRRAMRRLGSSTLRRAQQETGTAIEADSRRIFPPNAPAILDRTDSQ